MVRSVPRSRGCETCRRRKVKVGTICVETSLPQRHRRISWTRRLTIPSWQCDEAVPKCKQCHRIGKSCPGPSSGVFILRMLPPLKGSHSGSGSKSIKSKASQGGPLSQYQPSQALAFEQIFISHFISSFAHPLIGDGRHQSWMQYLPTFLSDCDLVRPSVRAATLAYYAYCTHDPAIEKEAGRWYLVALSRQRSWLSARYSRGGGCRDQTLIPTDQEICTSMMLLYYELIRPTAVASWMTHFSGACQLMELRRPINCQTGVSKLFLQSLRVLNVSNLGPQLLAHDALELASSDLQITWLCDLR